MAFCSLLHSNRKLKKELENLKNPSRSGNPALVGGNGQALYANDQELVTFSPNLYYGSDD